MSQEPLISVLVPVYNIERYIGRCLESIIVQTYKNLEIIVVDDGSTDRSGEICDLYASKDSRIKVIHKANGGLVSARKAGMKLATGEYVGYVDGDDWIGAEFYSVLVSSIQQSCSDVVVAGFTRVIFDKTAKIMNAYPLGVYEDACLEELFTSMISYGAFFQHGITTYLWNKLFKRELIKDFQLSIDERITIGEDGATVYPALLKCNRISIIDNCAYYYIQREDSMLKKTSSFYDEIQILSILYQYLKSALGENINKYGLLKQVQKYLLSTFIIRSGGILSESIHQPFSKDIKGKSIVVCGAGTFGQQLIKRIDESKYCNIVEWVDDDYWEYRRCCLNVNPLTTLLNLQYDYIVIGMVNSQASQNIKNQLIDCGISPSKILTLKVDTNDVENYLNQYLSLGKYK